MSLVPASSSCFLDFFQEKNVFFVVAKLAHETVFFTMLLQKIADK